MTREEYFGKLLALFSQHIEAYHPDEEANLEEIILQFIESNPVPKD